MPPRPPARAGNTRQVPVNAQVRERAIELSSRSTPSQPAQPPKNRNRNPPSRRATAGTRFDAAAAPRARGETGRVRLTRPASAVDLMSCTGSQSPPKCQSEHRLRAGPRARRDRAVVAVDPVAQAGAAEKPNRNPPSRRATAGTRFDAAAAPRAPAGKRGGSG